MPKMHVRQPGFTYSAFRLFTKNKKEHRISKKQEIDDILLLYMIFAVNVHGILLWKIQNEYNYWCFSKNIKWVWKQTKKYEWVKEGNVAIDQLNHSCKVMIYKYMQQLMKTNLLLRKDFLKPWKKVQVYDFNIKKCVYWYIRWHS